MAAKSSRYRAKKGVLGALFVAVIFALGAALLARGDLIPWPMADKFGWLFVVFGVLAAWDWWATSYNFDQDDLVIRSALGKSRIALCNIESMKTSPSVLKLQCQQLRGSKWVNIAPLDRERFLSQLYVKCPWLQKK
mgnify:FL=1